MNENDRFLGLLWGLVVGDCLGSPIQFTGKDDHPHVTEMVPCETFGTPPGYWTDDSSMAFCVAESVARLGRFDRPDVARNFVRWFRDGFWSSLPRAFDVGGATAAACRAIERTGSLENGEESSQGNGSVMRLAPSWLAARAFGRPEILHECSDLTHRSRRVRETVDRMARILDELAETGETSAVSLYATRDEVNNSGWCVSTVEAALWALNSTDSFETALVAAVNLGGDADSIGAVCGQLAGAKYGVGAIPERWLAAIKERAQLADLFERFLASLGWSSLVSAAAVPL
jgi:ADP-ribosyl-[dinitrogen reductase] hydrolase